MGWCSGTDVFDTVVKDVLINKASKEQIIRNLIIALEDKDWDCHQDSDYYDNPKVQKIMKELHPDWEDDNDN